MNINATLLGQFILLSVIVISGLSYYLGKRKTQNVKTTTFIGFLLSFMPPLGLIFVAVLVLKNDVSNDEASNV
jgi:Na+-driven multidrug efflux pump